MASLTIIVLFLLIALMFAGGAIIIVPILAIAGVFAIAWFVVFEVLGVERIRAEGARIPELRRRAIRDIERELHVNRLDGEPPGGAEGGDDSPSANRLVLPAHDGTPWGDTDQHSSSVHIPAGRH